MNHTNLKQQLDENGWVLIKDVFTEAEIEEMRKDAYRSKENGFDGELLSNPYLGHLIYDERIIDIINGLLEGQPVYFGDSTYVVNNKEWGFHKDNTDKNDFNAPDWKHPFTILRAGIYLQDHMRDSGGLLLRDKSHKTISNSVGRAFNVPVKKGDLVIWFLTTTHSGNAKLFRGFPNLIVDPKYYRFIPDFLFQPKKVERIAIFMTYAKRSAHLDRYLEYLKTRQYSVASWQKTNYDPNVVELAKNKGLEVISMKDAVRHLRIEDLNDRHADIPY